MSPVSEDTITAGRTVIVLWGGGSGSGKTALAEELIRRRAGWAALKLSPSDLYASVLVEDDPAAETDTGRMLRAGASPSILVRAAREAMAEAFREALSLIPDDRPILVEGHSALAVCRPDHAIVVVRPGLGPAKKEPAELLAAADVLFINEEHPGAGRSLPPAAPNPEYAAGMAVVRGCLDRSAPPLGIEELEAILAARGRR
jgi:molybdopterin-guanine dinucleotide biosynthesis protein